VGTALYEFDRATAVSAAGDGRFAADVHDGWDIGGNANGGYVLAIAARAMARHAGRPDPVSITAHYLSPGPPGAAEVAVSIAKAGKRFATVSAAMTQGGRPLLQALGTFGELSANDGPTWHAEPAPTLPPPHRCSPREPFNGVVAVPLMSRLDVRLVPGEAERGVVEGWFAFADGRPVDTLGLLLAADAFPPAYFTLGLGAGWVPTVELTVHARAVPAPGPVACRFTTRHVQDGLLEEDGRIWDAGGRLVAMSRQLALAPRT
jgi:hypothetical protein